MNVETLPMIRSADLAWQTPKLTVADKKTLEIVRAYVDHMRQQKKEIRAITIARSAYGGLLKAVNKGRDDDSRFTDLTFDGIAFEVVHG